MVGIIQKIRTILIPESGIDLEPSRVVEAEVSTAFTRVFAYVVGKEERGGILIRATSDGRLYVAAAGTTFEWYDVETDDAPAAWDAAQTYEYTEAILRTDIIIEDFDAEIQWRSQVGVWGGVKRAPVGAMSFDFTHYGIRIRNRVGASVAAFEITVYR